MAQALHERIEDELGLELLFQIPREMIRFYQWGDGIGSELRESFPSCLGEFEAAGRCIAYGEATAAVFHLVRVMDKGFRVVADSIKYKYENSNWGGIGRAIRDIIHANGKNHSDEWKAKEKLYSTVLADITGISKAHRNPTLHELERKYTDGEAEHFFVLTERLMLHLSENGMKE
jgi:hypothetical protein